MAFGDDVAQRGWQTGSVVPVAMLPTLAPYLTRPGQQPTQVVDADWLVVVSQNCDIIATRLDAEPLVEVLHCHAVNRKPDKGRVDLRSTRHLDFRPNKATHTEVVVTAHALTDRYVIPRELLVEYAPAADRQLSKDAATRVLAWFALRASRPSWPDSFVGRISPAKKALEQALDSLIDEIAQVRVAIAEENTELEDGSPYRVAVYFVVDEDVWNHDVDGRNAIHLAFAKFIVELKACKGVEVNEDLSGVVPGDQFSWQDVQQTHEWNFANLTHRE